MAIAEPSGESPQAAMTESQEPEQAAEWVWLARIRRPQGRKGEVFADILTDFPEKFADRRQLWLVADPDSPRAKSSPAKSNLAPREVELVAHWLHKGGIVLHFAQSNSISDAEALAGFIVAIPLTDRASLADDEVYIADLIGCMLFDVAGAEPASVGMIEDVDRTAGPVALLVVNPPGSEEEILIPFAKSYLRTIDLPGKRVEMALPEGLVALNASGKP
jgi:16S rRNA processing protein RimM